MQQWKVPRERITNRKPNHVPGLLDPLDLVLNFQVGNCSYKGKPLCLLLQYELLRRAVLILCLVIALPAFKGFCRIIFPLTIDEGVMKAAE